MAESAPTGQTADCQQLSETGALAVKFAFVCIFVTLRAANGVTGVISIILRKQTNLCEARRAGHAAYLMSLAFARIQLATRSGAKLFMIIPVGDYGRAHLKVSCLSDWMKLLLLVSHLA